MYLVVWDTNRVFDKPLTIYKRVSKPIVNPKSLTLCYIIITSQYNSLYDWHVFLGSCLPFFFCISYNFLKWGSMFCAHLGVSYYEKFAHVLLPNTYEKKAIHYKKFASSNNFTFCGWKNLILWQLTSMHRKASFLAFWTRHKGQSRAPCSPSELPFIVGDLCRHGMQHICDKYHVCLHYDLHHVWICPQEIICIDYVQWPYRTRVPGRTTIVVAPLEVRATQGVRESNDTGTCN